MMLRRYHKAKQEQTKVPEKAEEKPKPTRKRTTKASDK